MRRLLCLRLPNWPVQRLLAAKPELDRRRPVILHSRDARRRHLVAACNAVAAKRGVQRFMPLAEAASLIGRREEGYLVPADSAADLAALARVAESCERFSPLVGWETVTQLDVRTRGTNSTFTVTAPDHLFLDVTGIGILFGSEETLLQEIKTDLARFGYQVQLALADTIGAAWAVASANVGPSVATGGPDETVLLSELSVSSLRLPHQTLEVLSQLGITQIGQLLQLPRVSLAARFGAELLLRLDQLLGTAQEMIVPHRPPPEFVAERLLEYPAEGRELVECIVEELVEHLATQLTQRQLGAMRLSCRFDCSPGRPLLLQVGLFQPSAHPRHLGDLLRMQLEQLTLSGPVGRITLAVPLTAPLEIRQGELFEGNRQAAARQFRLLIDRLSSRLGANVVLRPELTADSLPECAVEYVPVVEAGRKRSRPLAAPGPWHRPLLLRSPPVALEVIALAAGPPQQFRLVGREHRIAQWEGPERIEGGWWRGRSVRRDYYRVRTESGERYWVFRRLQDGKWYLHGEFA